jgi:hypothetical protein
VTENDLGDVFVTEMSAAEEACQGRGLLITNCREERLIPHLCHAIRNSLPLRSIVVPLSHIVVEEIATTLETQHKLSVWRTAHDTEGGIGLVAAAIWVTVPENLAVLDRHARSKIGPPDIIHVVNLALPAVAIHRFSICGPSRYRLSDIGRHKAACQANGATPYVIVWTPEGCQELPYRYLCQAIGVDAWLYADGRTLRTAAFNDRAAQRTSMPM